MITDHKPLVNIFKSTCRGSVRTDRIKLRHQDVDYQVLWQPGVTNNADFLSRHATKWNKIPRQWKEEAQELEKTVWFLNLSPYSEAISIPSILEESKKDSRLRKLVHYVKKGFIPSKESRDWRPYINIVDSTVSDAGLVLKDEKIILPKSLWQLAIDKAHQGGHPGMTRMKTRIRSHFWIPQLHALVEEKVNNCEARRRLTQKGTKELVAPQKTTGVAWEEVSIDLFGPLPDRKHVLVVQDIVSRFPSATVLPNTSTGPVIKALEDIYLAYGHPDGHRTDNGPPFNSKGFQEFSKSKGIEHILRYPYHPQGNPCETFMKPLGKALKVAYYNRENAQTALDKLLQAYRSTPHPTTKMAPGDVLFRYGYQTEFPSKKNDEAEIAAAIDRDQKQKMSRKGRMNESIKRMPMQVKIGDQILVREFPRGKKFDPIYANEVFEVVQVEETGVTVRDKQGKLKRRHKDDIKLYHRRKQLVRGSHQGTRGLRKSYREDRG